MKVPVKFYLITKKLGGCIKMKWIDYINIFCTIISIIGAYKSLAYYKKSKHLSIYANTNVAYMEIQKIISVLTEMLKLSNQTRGINTKKEVSKKGESIKASINKIREILPANDSKAVDNILHSQEMQVEEYIDSFITGTALIDEKLIIDNNFNKCQQSFRDIQILLKQKLENTADKIK